jgi:hypothetical protein
MTNGSQNCRPFHNEDPGQLPPVTALHARTAAKRRAQPAFPHARMRELEQRPFLQIEGAIERMVGIAEARHVEQSILCKPLVRFLGRLHVHERNLRSGRCDGGAETRNVFHRLATEGSAEVTEEDQKNRSPIREFADRRRDHHGSSKFKVQSSKFKVQFDSCKFDSCKFGT